MNNFINDSLFEAVNTVILRETDSTNSEAKRRVLSGESLPMLVISDSQTGGRGRLGRSFYSPGGTGLYMSLAYEAEEDMTEAVKITSAAAVAVCRAIEELSSTQCMIKWVNDVYIDEKKVCGILTEATSISGKTVIILGIGVNCTTDKFPEDIRSRAGSAGIENREALAWAICRHVTAFLSGENFIDEYRRRSLVLGREVTYIKNGETRKGVAAAVEDNGALLLLDGTVLSSGEITLRF